MAEVAQLFPGTNQKARNESYLDDFEAARTIFDLTRQPTRWRLGATPQRQQAPIFRRVHLPIHCRLPTTAPECRSIPSTLVFLAPQGALGVASNIDLDDVNAHVYERPFLPQDLFPGRSARVVQLPESILDVSYFPAERGMYNYNTNLEANGNLPNPRQNFGAVTRAIASDIDFDNANIENVTFWLMDPFVTGAAGVVRGSNDDTKNKNNTTGGKLVSSTSAIFRKMSLKMAGMNLKMVFRPVPITASSRLGAFKQQAGGKAPTQQFVTNAFQSGVRDRQDIGLDGLSSQPTIPDGRYV